MTEQLTRNQFASTNGQNFQLITDSPVEVKLIEVTASKDCGGGFESFSLVFAGDENDALPQNTYAVQNETLGSTRIFLTPVQYPQSERGKIYYQAVFSYKKN